MAGRTLKKRHLFATYSQDIVEREKVSAVFRLAKFFSVRIFNTSNNAIC